jgi:hypothetical protein
MLIPFFNVLGLNFNHNTVLIPLWAIATYSFVRSYEERSIWWSIVAGIFAGICVLAKYWSFLLLLELSAAALADRDRLLCLKSWCPWIVTAVSFSIVLPHIVWLSANDFPTIVYSHERLAASPAHLLHGLVGYIAAPISYLSAPLLLLAFLIRPTRAVLTDLLFPKERHRRFAAVAFWVPILAALPLGIVAWAHLSGLWLMSGLALLGVVLLSSDLVKVRTRSVTKIAAAAATVCFAGLVASPIVAVSKLWAGAAREAACLHAAADP